MKKLLSILLAAGLLVSSSALNAADGDPRGTKRGREDADNASAASGEAPAPSEKAARLEVPPIISLVALKPGDDGTDEFKNRSHVVALDLTTTELYTLLDVKREDERDAEVIKAKIKALKRSLLLAWHPDKATDSAFANEICKQIVPLINFLSMVLVDNAYLKHTYDAKLLDYRKHETSAPASAPAVEKYRSEDIIHGVINSHWYEFAWFFILDREILNTMTYNGNPLLAEAFVIAARMGHSQIFKQLFADFTIRHMEMNYRMYQGGICNPIIIRADALALIQAAEHNQGEILTQLLLDDSVRTKKIIGHFVQAEALIQAALRGHNNIIKILLEDPTVCAMSYRGQPVLNMALRFAKETFRDSTCELIQAVIDAQADAAARH